MDTVVIEVDMDMVEAMGATVEDTDMEATVSKEYLIATTIADLHMVMDMMAMVAMAVMAVMEDMLATEGMVDMAFMAVMEDMVATEGMVDTAVMDMADMDTESKESNIRCNGQYNGYLNMDTIRNTDILSS